MSWNPLIVWYANVAVMTAGTAALLAWPAPTPDPPPAPSPTTVSTPVPPPTVAPTSLPTTRPPLPPTTKPLLPPTTRPPSLPPPPPSTPKVGLTFLVADTEGLRGREGEWVAILRDTAQEPKVARWTGGVSLLLVDAEGERPWTVTDGMPAARTGKPFKNKDWNGILKALGRATARPGCGDRVFWLVEDSVKPDDLPPADRLPAVGELVPATALSGKRLTLIWNGYGGESKDLAERFSQGKDRRLIAASDRRPPKALPLTVAVELDTVP